MRIFSCCLCSSGLLKESGFRVKTPQFRLSYALHLNYLDSGVQISVPTVLVAKSNKRKDRMRGPAAYSCYILRCQPCGNGEEKSKTGIRMGKI